MDPKKILLPLDLVQKMLNYLGNRPYAEVHELIKDLQNQGELIEGQEVVNETEE